MIKLKNRFKGLLLPLGFIILFSLIIFSVNRAARSLMAKSSAQNGLLAMENGDLDIAKIHFKTAIRKSTAYLPAYLGLAKVLKKEKDYNNAIIYYEQALALSRNPQLSRLARLELADIYSNTTIKPPVRADDWTDQGIGHLEALIKAEPNNPQFHMMLGFSAFNQANPGKGFQSLNKASALATQPAFRFIHEKLMQFYLTINLKEKAEEEKKLINQ